jgi:putative FmdB family regulatory protein
MASYDLECRSCGESFEVYVQGFLKDEDKQCPQCGSFQTQQKFSSFLKNLGGSGGGGCEVPRSSGFG